jgi:hypothetical protein
MIRRRKSPGYSSVVCCAASVQPLETRRLLAADVLKESPATEVVDDSQFVVTTQQEVTIQTTAAPLISAGTVRVSVNRAGDILITGDADSNTVFAEITAGKLLVTGGEAGTMFLGSGKEPVSSLELPLPAKVRSLTVNLGRGDDSLAAVIRSDVSIARDVTIATGAGNDSIRVELIGGDVRIGQDLTVDTGNGDDQAQILLGAGSELTAGRDVSFRGAAGADRLQIANNASEAMSSGLTAAIFKSLPNNTATALSQQIRAGRDFVVNMGAGNDAAQVLTAEAGRDVSITGGLGDDGLLLSNVRAKRHVTVSDSEQMVVQNVTTQGSLIIRSGIGNDRFIGRELNVGRLDVDTGAGNDVMVLTGPLTIRTSGVLNGGAGANSAYVANPQTKLAVRRATSSLTASRAEELLDEVLSGLLPELDGVQPFQMIMAE